MLSRAIPLLTLSLALAGCLAAADDGAPLGGDDAALAFSGRLGETCAQLAWAGECARGLSCEAAPDGRLDSFCTQACATDAQCPTGAACYEGACIATCGMYPEWPWACPYGTEARVQGHACVCIPGRPRPVGYDEDDAP